MPTKINILSQVKGMSNKTPCVVATTGDTSFSAISIIDGITLSNNDRVLVWKQSNATQNGIYIFSGGTLTRALDSNAPDDFIQGMQILVISGNTYGETLFYQTSVVSTIGSSNINFGIFGGLNGTSGSSGTSGTTGTSGTSGTSGSSGTSGTSGSSGTSGTSGSSGTSGTSGTSPASQISGSGTSGYLAKFTGTTNLGNSVIQESSSLIGVNVTPTRVLHLSSSGSNSAIRLDNTVSGRPFLLLYDDSQNLTFINSSDSGYTAFNSGTGASTTKMLITNGGNVGIGTTSPGYQLEIVGNQNNGNVVRIDSYANDLLTPLLIRKSRGTFASPLALIANDMLGGFLASGFKGDTFSGNVGGVLLRAETNFTSGLTQTYLEFTTTLTTGTGREERMRITSGGNVGIGTNASNGAGKLTIHNTTAFDTTSFAANQDNLFLTSATSAGLGVFGSSIGFARTNNVDRRIASITAVQGTASANQVGLAFFTHPTVGGTDSIAEAMRIDYNGNVGIGTTTPTEGQLQISGNSDSGANPNRPRIVLKNLAGTPVTWTIQPWSTSGDANLSIYRTGAAGNILLASTGGNVGIGTTNPISTFTINSDAAGGVGGIVTNNVYPMRLINSPTAGSGSYNVFDLRMARGGVSNRNPSFSFSTDNTDGDFYNICQIGSIADLASGNTIAGNLIFSTKPSGSNVTERMRITSGGNVGIGADGSAGYKLDVNGTGRFSGALSGTSASFSSTLVVSGQAAFGTSVNTTHDVLIQGTTSNNTKNALRIQNSSAASLFAVRNDGAVDLYGNTSINGTLLVTGAATFSSSVNVTTTGTFGFQDYTTQTTQKVLVLNAEGVSGNYSPALFNIYTKPGTTVNGIASIIIKSKYGTDAESGNLFEFKGNGDFTIAGSNATKASGTAWINPSDVRLKTNIRPYNKGLAEVLKIQPKIWNFNEDSGFDQTKEHVSIIAQEIQDFMPEMISTYKGELNGKETELLRVDASDMTWLLVKAIQELQSQIDILKQEIINLKNK